ncbi:hypothetical protein L227DRAFT_613501 [Lentinus tigrinus ALCF2SS1-6]|uniref:Protein kinase domain-containing protein n=1 Tax=Lentinus tigrinus ALCF2SS1-6 TaxID=1328759 RepID=A0A5C2S3Q0_9APHY|nr:hypothetical protein L227DRAFT_613501 [Lentinus tigrinus ALCF2SS1-6]
MPSAVRQSVADLLVPEAEALGKLTEEEEWWRDNSYFLEYKSYFLRRRYQPRWEPSWKNYPNRHPSEFEDWHRHENTAIIDARRMVNRYPRLVALKRINKSEELFLIDWLYSPVNRRDPRNHTVQVLDKWQMDDRSVLAMPLLRPCDDPAWDTVGEVVSFLKQVFDGVEFMHEKNVAHRDIKASSIMYDPLHMYYEGFYHPLLRDRNYELTGKAKHRTRTDQPVKYFFVSFGKANRYWDTTRPRESPLLDRKMTLGELQHLDDRPVDPFKTDIYALGKMVRTTVLMKFKGVSFLAPLVKDMLQDNASKRPTAPDVVRRFNALLGALTERQLRARLVPAYEEPVLAVRRNICHRFRTMRYKLQDKDAVPLPVDPL